MALVGRYVVYNGMVLLVTMLKLQGIVLNKTAVLIILKFNLIMFLTYQNLIKL